MILGVWVLPTLPKKDALYKREPVIFANPALPSFPAPFFQSWAKGSKTVNVFLPPLSDPLRKSRQTFALPLFQPFLNLPIWR